MGSSEQMLEVLAGVTACQDKTFDYLTAAVVEKLSMLSGCICILIDWDEKRRKLIDYLQGFNIPLLILLVTKDRDKYSDLHLENLHILPTGEIQTALSNIGIRY